MGKTSLTKHWKFILLLFATAVCLIMTTFFPDKLSTKRVIIAELSNVNFDSRSPDSVLSKPKEYLTDQKTEPKSIAIRLEMLALDDNYDNLFQTANDPLAIRLELTHPNTLNLLVGTIEGLKLYKVTDTLALNVWHTIGVIINENKRAEVILDGQTMLSFTDSIAYEISDITVGTGYNKRRGFQGEIKNFHIRYERYQWLFILELIVFLVHYIPVITVWVVAYRLITAVYKPSSNPNNPTASEVLLFPGVATIVIIAGIIAGNILHVSPVWLSFMLIGFAAPLCTYIYTKVFGYRARSSFARLLRIMAVLSFFAAVAFLVYNSFPILIQSKQIFIITCIIGIAVLYTLAFSGHLPVSIRDGKERLFLTLTIAIFSLAVWLALLDLPNWRQFCKSLTDRPVATSIFFFFFTGIIHHYLFKTPNAALPPALSVLSTKLNRPIKFLLVASALLLFFLMSFRHDTLFLGTSEAHWEYFIGPIRNLKSGSWLLWDTPSQYGFLNLLIASLLPFKSSWESFYVFQGALLFIASCMMFRIYLANRSLRSSIFFGFSVTFSSLFFADPDLIGPYLYPSSSVMRFFWCYVLLYFLFQVNARSGTSLKKIVFLGTVLWLSGFLWSSESAIYSSVIFFPAIFTAILQDYHRKLKDPGKSNRLFKYIFLYMSVPILSLILLIGVITAYYWLRLSHIPDFYAFVEHGFAYAGGFGYINLNPSGPIWLLFLLFCGILFIIVKVVLKDPLSRHLVPLVGAAGCLWGISSYFVGRAVANNVTAILPLLGFISIVVLNAAEARGLNPSHVLFKAISVPLFTVILMTSFGNMGFVDKLKTFQTLDDDISQNVRVAEPLLQDLVNKASIRKTDPVVYYGFAAAMPRWKLDDQFVLSENTWMSNPLQLIEDPISEVRRSDFVHRFMSTYTGRGGYFIQAKGEAEDRIANWLSIINKTHKAVRVFENDKWKITYFERR